MSIAESRIPWRNRYIPYAAIWLLYAGLCFYLYHHTPARHFPTEGYITDMTLAEAWTFANRPIFVPMIYKIFHNYGLHIARFQWFMAVLAWTFLAGSIALILQRKPLKIAGFALVLAFSISRDVYFWNSLLLSESLSHSLLALLLGGWIIWHHRSRQPMSVRTQICLGIGTLAVSCAWATTRDANAYALLIFGVILALPPGRYWRWRCVMATAYIALFAFQMHHADMGNRWHLPYINILGERILTGEDHTQFFIERGMPANDSVLRYAGHRAWDFHPDHDMRVGLGGWLDERGQRVYAEWLLLRPVQTASEPVIHWQQVTAYEFRMLFLADVEAIPRWQQIVTAIAYPEHAPLLPIPVPLLLTGLAILAAVVYGVDSRHWIPLVMLILAYVLAGVAWHGDADSVQRHGFQVGILWRLAVWILLLLALDRRVVLPNETEACIMEIQDSKG